MGKIKDIFGNLDFRRPQLPLLVGVGHNRQNLFFRVRLLVAVARLDMKRLCNRFRGAFKNDDQGVAEGQKEPHRAGNGQGGPLGMGDDPPLRQKLAERDVEERNQHEAEADGNDMRRAMGSARVDYIIGDASVTPSCVPDK